MFAHKAKAHATLADVMGENATEWEWKANNLADKFAKQGAALHALTETHESECKAIAIIAYQAARWPAEQAVRQRIAEAADSDPLPARNQGTGKVRATQSGEGSKHTPLQNMRRSR